MSQHDLTIDNANGSTVRSDLQNALQALGSLQSGASAPATTYAYMLWADTTNSLLKQRNAANSGWIIRGSLLETRALAKSGAYTVVDDDFGALIKATGTWTLSLTAAATLADGFTFSVRNVGSGTITIDPNASETIDGATTISLAAGESCQVWCDGTAFYTVGKQVTATYVSDALIVLRDEKSSGTNGGGFTSGAWQTRDLNTEAVDTASLCSLSSNQFTLTAGTYRIRAVVPGYACSSHQAKLYNATDASDIILGTTAFSSVGGNGFSQSVVEGRFTIGASKALEIRHRCTSTKATDGYGVASSIGTEVYTIVSLTKEQ